MILHIDMDAFFASVEQSSNPALRGIPIAVTGAATRSVIITSSYEARKFGIRTGMTVPEAKKLYPKITIVIANFSKYASTSRKIMEIFRKYGETEVFSVDEAFLDIGANDPFFIATKIKGEIMQMFNITCSVGVGKNKYIAKLASGINKPNGFFVATSLSDIKDISIKEVCGIGNKNFKKLMLLGVKTVGNFVETSDEILKSVMGISGIRLKMALKGEWNEPVKSVSEEPKSVGHSMTLPKDIWYKEEIKKAVFQLSEKIAHDLRHYNRSCRKILLHIRYKNFESFSLTKCFLQPTNHELEIFKYCMELIETVKLKKSIRLLGIVATNLIIPSQLTLFQRETEMYLKAIDKIRDRWGFDAITWGALINKYNHKSPISPAWRPEKP